MLEKKKAGAESSKQEILAVHILSGVPTDFLN